MGYTTPQRAQWSLQAALRIAALALIVAGLGLAPSTARATATFMGLGFLPGGHLSYATQSLPTAPRLLVAPEVEQKHFAGQRPPDWLG